MTQCTLTQHNNKENNDTYIGVFLKQKDTEVLFIIDNCICLKGWKTV
jgi:hypothetical protein